MSDMWTREHTPDTRRIRVRYATWRIVDHLYGQRFRTRLEHGSIILMGRGDGRQWIWFQASTEGRREKGEEGKMSRVLGEGGESTGSGQRVGGVGGGGRGVRRGGGGGGGGGGEWRGVGSKLDGVLSD